MDFIGYFKRRHEPMMAAGGTFVPRFVGDVTAHFRIPGQGAPDQIRQTDFSPLRAPLRPAANRFTFNALMVDGAHGAEGFGAIVRDLLAPDKRAAVGRGAMDPVGPSPNIRRPRPGSYGDNFELR